MNEQEEQEKRARWEQRMHDQGWAKVFDLYETLVEWRHDQQSVIIPAATAEIYFKRDSIPAPF